jgi:hypothetical protein
MDGFLSSAGDAPVPALLPTNRDHGSGERYWDRPRPISQNGDGDGRHNAAYQTTDQ